MNADVPPLLAAEAAPAPLLLLRIHLDIFNKLPRIEIPVHARDFGPEYPRVRTPGVPPEPSTRRQSRIPGVPVQSLNFPESAPIPTGIPDP
jgi:hypothetical protein